VFNFADNLPFSYLIAPPKQQRFEKESNQPRNKNSLLKIHLDFKHDELLRTTQQIAHQKS